MLHQSSSIIQTISKCPFTEITARLPHLIMLMCVLVLKPLECEIVRYVWLQIVVTITFMKRDIDQEAIMLTSLSRTRV